MWTPYDDDGKYFRSNLDYLCLVLTAAQLLFFCLTRLRQGVLFVLGFFIYAYYYINVQKRPLFFVFFALSDEYFFVRTPSQITATYDRSTLVYIYAGN